MPEERKKILEVKHLKQYFKNGRTVTKGVDDVSFDIYEGEVFGLVGESPPLAGQFCSCTSQRPVKSFLKARMWPSYMAATNNWLSAATRR